MKILLICCFLVLVVWVPQLEGVTVTVNPKERVFLGNTLTLVCNFTSNESISSASSLSWSFGKSEICKYILNKLSLISNNDFEHRTNCTVDIVKKSIRLSVKNMQYQDSGLYECKVSNFPDLWADQSSTNVSVEPPRDNRAQSLRVTCEGPSDKDGSAAATSWTFQEIETCIADEMNMKGPMSCIADLPNESSAQLSIKPAQRDQRGDYKCEMMKLPAIIIGQGSARVYIEPAKSDAAMTQAPGGQPPLQSWHVTCNDPSNTDNIAPRSSWSFQGAEICIIGEMERNSSDAKVKDHLSCRADLPKGSIRLSFNPAQRDVTGKIVCGVRSLPIVIMGNGFDQVVTVDKGSSAPSMSGLWNHWLLLVSLLISLV